MGDFSATPVSQRVALAARCRRSPSYGDARAQPPTADPRRQRGRWHGAGKGEPPPATATGAASLHKSGTVDGTMAGLACACAETRMCEHGVLRSTHGRRARGSRNMCHTWASHVYTHTRHATEKRLPCPCATHLPTNARMQPGSVCVTNTGYGLHNARERWKFVCSPSAMQHVPRIC